MQPLCKVSGVLILTVCIVGGILAASRAQKEEAPVRDGDVRYSPTFPEAYLVRPTENIDQHAVDADFLLASPPPVVGPHGEITHDMPKPQFNIPKPQDGRPKPSYALLGSLLFSHVASVHFAGPGMPPNSDGSLGGLVAEEENTRIEITERYIVRVAMTPDGTLHRTIYPYDELGKIEQVVSSERNQPYQNTVRQ